MKSFIRVSFILVALISLFPFVSAQSQEPDLYAPLYPPQTQESTIERVANHFLLSPFELLRYPMDQGAYYTEKYHLDKKAKWLYEKMLDEGLAPYGSIISMSGLGGGLKVDLIRLTKQSTRFPDLIAKSYVEWQNKVNFEVGSELGAQRIRGSGFHTRGTFLYQYMPEEHFYGIGPHTSAGDGTSYKIETTDLGYSLGYSPIPTVSADALFGFKKVNITNGEDGGRGIIDEIFRNKIIHGLSGDELLSFGGRLSHDSRNSGSNSTKGGREYFGFSFNEGLYSSDARYFKYELDISRYLRLWSDRRVLAIHLYGESNESTPDHYVPFHQMAKLGGFGERPRSSHALRGYDFNRFFDNNAVLFNVEYRFTIWEHGDFKMNTLVSFDEGQVFSRLSRFKFRDFRGSYGGGIRVSYADITLLSIETSFADEGPNFYVKTSSPF